MSQFNNEEYRVLVSDLIGDVYYTSTSYIYPSYSVISGLRLTSILLLLSRYKYRGSQSKHPDQFFA